MHFSTLGLKRFPYIEVDSVKTIADSVIYGDIGTSFLFIMIRRPTP